MKKYYLLILILSVFVQTRSFGQCDNCVASSPNLVQNGDFESANCVLGGTYQFTSTMFSTCTYNPWPINSHSNGIYTVAAGIVQSAWSAGSNPLPGSTYRYVGDGGYGSSGFEIAWSQNVNVQAGKVYRFGVWYFPENSDEGVQLAISGTDITARLTNLQQGQWNFICANYSATSTGSVSLQIRKYRMSLNTIFNNDFSIDDIEFRELNQIDGTITSSQVNCASGPVTLTAAGTVGSGSYSYQWSTGETTAQIIVSPLVTTLYSVIITDNATGCNIYVPVTVTVSDINVTIGEEDIELCSASPNILPTFIVGGTPPFTYQWNTSATTSSIEVNYNNPGVYSVTVTDSKGCTGTDDVITWQNPGVCLGDKLFQNTSSLPSYNRYNSTIKAGHHVDPVSTQGDVIVTSTQDVLFRAREYITLEEGFSVQENGVFTAEIFEGCTLDGGTIRVINNSPCSYNLTAITEGGSGNYSYLWNTGATTPYINVSPTSPTNYSVLVTDNCLSGSVTLYTTVTPRYIGAPTVSMFMNLVTPNGDSANDIWILGDNNKTQYAFNSYLAHIDVFNRWGSLVWAADFKAGSTGLAQGDVYWDPNGPHNWVNEGVYYVRVYLLTCTESVEKVGWVQVIRGSGFRLAASESRPKYEIQSDTTGYRTASDLVGLDQININPNPSSGLLMISLPDDAGESRITVYNYLGREVADLYTEENESSYKLDLSNEEAGLYMVKLRIRGRTITRKIFLNK